MNFLLPFIPERSAKPRQKGITMMMDKGLSIRQVEDFIDTGSAYTDFVKFGFGTSVITDNLLEKIKLYKKAGVEPYFGGTLFEAFIIRGMFDDYVRTLEKYGIETVEVSDGSMTMVHEKKQEYISKLSGKFKVLSEVGSKQKGVVIPPDKWIECMKNELKAGSWKVIAEARESGTVGIYHSNGSANEELIVDISQHIPGEKIIWEAPTGKQQVYFINHYGSDVSLGNIAPNDVIPLECLRLGLRGDTFFNFLPEELKKFKPST
ncbi:MAG TPA: phosphosulfolactate synthase [Bacteroidales bacterium]|nr:phosphosulfolactate synthase [Bacteroidales bacterium]